MFVSCFWSKWNKNPSLCKLYEWKMNVRSFLVFDFSWFSRIQNEDGQLMFPEFQEFWISKIQKWTHSDFAKFKKWTLKVCGISKFLSFRIIQKIFSHFVQGCSLIFFDFIQVILLNKMKKYGLPGSKTPIIHEMLSFRCLMPWNRHFITCLLYTSPSPRD